VLEWTWSELDAQSSLQIAAARFGLRTNWSCRVGDLAERNNLELRNLLRKLQVQVRHARKSKLTFRQICVALITVEAVLALLAPSRRSLLLI
ncbi:hypothetical protein ACMD2_02924, partial [Ananas comosus]